MAQRWILLVRGISNTPMDSLRRAAWRAGARAVRSYGASGNLLVTLRAPAPSFQRRMAALLGAPVVAMTSRRLQRAAAQNPYASRRGSCVLFLVRAPSARARRAFARAAFGRPQPLLRGTMVYFVHPTCVRGSRRPVDFEALLGVHGTARSAGVVKRLLATLDAAVAA